MYLFNPDNDLALANFSEHYTPPASALKIARDLAILPLWYADEGSKIVAEGEENERFLESIHQLFAINRSLILFSDMALFPHENFTPWGWNPALRKKLLDANVAEEKLPSSDELNVLRDYSGRQHAVKMLRELKRESGAFCGESDFFTHIDDVLRFLALQSGNSVLKMPNSGSGKGLIWILGKITDKQTDWCRRVIREQGGVVAEPVLNKTRDFAMEFYAENGKIRFAGYSLFRSAASGAYLGNALMPDKDIERALSEFVPLNLINNLRDSLREKILRYFPLYNGFLGVDMMVCDTLAGYRVHPCVEINARMNMGMVARIFYDRFVETGSSGNFMVGFFKKTGDALVHHRKMNADFPLVIKNGKIKSGYLNLTPVVESTNYTAYVVI